MPALSTVRGADVAAATPSLRATATRTVGPDVLLDCRWLQRGGVGMATELSLRALKSLHDDGRFDRRVVVRGRAELLQPLAWGGVTIEHDALDPHGRWGQAGWQRDDGRLEVAFHQLRPLSNRPRLQWLHDLIPLHFATSTPDRFLRERYLRRIVSTSDALLVVSRHTHRCLVEEFGADPATMRVITYPVDQQLARDVARIRSASSPERRLLFLGRFARHKNVDRLVQAFGGSDFARDGGTLHLVGGTAEEIEALHRTHDLASLRVSVEGVVSRARIVELLATSSGLVQPSLEEGFGLPVWEARTVGLPVIAADAGSLPELITDRSNLFDPLDIDDLRAAIDRVAARNGAPNEPAPGSPSLADFGAVVVEGIELALARSRERRRSD